MNFCRYRKIKFGLLIDKLKVLKKLGLATFGGGRGSLLLGDRYFSGGRYFRGGGSLLSGFTSSRKKLTLPSGGLLLAGDRYYRNFMVCTSLQFRRLQNLLLIVPARLRFLSPLR